MKRFTTYVSVLTFGILVFLTFYFRLDSAVANLLAFLTAFIAFLGWWRTKGSNSERRDPGLRRISGQLPAETSTKGPPDLLDHGTGKPLVSEGRGSVPHVRRRVRPWVIATSVGAALWAGVIGVGWAMAHPHPFQAHRSAVERVSGSPDGSLVASAGRDGEVHLWNKQTGKAVGASLDHPGPVLAVTFSPRGDLLATGADDGARLWSVATHHMVGTTLSPRTGPVHDLAFTPNGSLLVTAGADRAIRVWRSATGSSDGAPLTLPASAERIAISPDGHTLAVASNGQVLLWDLLTRNTPVTLGRHNDIVTGLDFSSDGLTLLSGSRDRTVYVWDLARHTTTAAFKYGSSVHGAAFVPHDPKLIAVLLGNGRTEVDNVKISAMFVEMATVKGGTTIAVASDGDTVITGNEKGELLFQSIDFHANASSYVPSG